jgi:hypothetical protein
VRELTVERQVLRQVHFDLCVVRPLLGYLNRLLFSVKFGSAIVGFLVLDMYSLVR